MAIRRESIGLLLERDGELAQLSLKLKQAGAGQGSVVAIEGPAGVGKTGLLSALHSLAAEQGFRALKARGREREIGMAFAVASQLFEPPVLAAGVSERRQLLAGAARTGAGALGLAAGAAPESEFAAVHGLYWVCVNLARRMPLLLLVDDLQWVDRPSLAWLDYLGGRISELPVLLAVSVREGDPAAGETAVTSVVSDPAVHRMALAPLGASSVAAMVRKQLQNRASAAFCRACSDLTGGNPLLVTELMVAARSNRLTGSDEDAAVLREIAPAAVGPSVQTRLARMRPDAIVLAEALAVLGSQNEVVTAAAMAGLDVAAAELAADELAAAQILMPARPLDFFHPLIGESVYASIGLGARRLSHRRAAALLDRAGTADRVAAHLLATGPAGDGWVVGRLRDAAADAHERGAPELAATFLRRALAEPPPEAERAELMLRLGSAEWHAGQPAAISHVEQALAQGREVATIAGAAGTLADAYLISDRIDAAVAVLQEASRRVAVTDPPNAASLEAWSVLLGIQDDRTAPEALETVDRWRTGLHTMPDPPLHCLVALAQIAVRRNQAEAAVPLLERILAYRPYPPPVDAGACAIAALVYLEDYGALDQLCGDTLASLEQRSAVPWLVVVTGFSAWGMLHRGELADAEAQSRWALQHAGTGTLVAIDLVAHLVDVLIERDELELAEAELARIPSPLDSHSITVLNYLMARGRLRAALGRPAEALQDFLLVGKRCEPLGIVLGWYQWRSQAAIVQASLGRADDARTLARAEVAVARCAGLPRQLGLALRSCGLVEPGGAGLELLAESVSVLETSQSRIELARALADYGAALRRAGHRTQARRTLERALDLAHYCGARRIAAWAREELVAAGAKPRREAITGRDALTPSELRVARLAAAGHTDREIAQSLFITTKTVSVHLSRAYRKLGVSCRSDLAKALASSIS